MSLTTTQFKIVAAAMTVVCAGSGLALFAMEERAIGQRDLLLHVADSTATLAKDSVAIRSQIAQEAVKVAEQARDKANAKIARQRADSVKQDSLIRVSANARTDALRVLADSAASVAALHATLSRLVRQSQQDSVSWGVFRDHADRTIASLLATVTADSLALHAEQSRSASLVALNASTAEKVKLLTQAQPSTFGKILRYTALAAISVEAGRMSAGRLP